MNNIISKISEIESAASSIMDNANLQKQALSKDMEQRTKAFDEQLEAETNEKIQAMRSEMELEMQKQLVRELEIIMKQEGELLKNKFFTHALC